VIFKEYHRLENIVQGYNIIVVWDEASEHILMCKRRKSPYKGLYNLVGGKIEHGETGEAAAYRELMEETGIGSGDIELCHIMDFRYYTNPYYLEVYGGRLNKTVAVSGDENELFWINGKSDFFDVAQFAGDGNIGHIIAVMKASMMK
jgi:8-oxo-dGTP diphosphatase